MNAMLKDNTAEIECHGHRVRIVTATRIRDMTLQIRFDFNPGTFVSNHSSAVCEGEAEHHVTRG